MPERPDVIVVGVALGTADAAALELARTLARCIDARIELVHALPYEQLIAIPPPDWERAERERAAAALEALAAPLRGALQVGTHVRPNPSPVRALHEAAEELGARFLVVGRTHRHGLSAVVLGGVAERLLHAAPCAVAIAPPAGMGELRRIGVAFIDGPEGAAALDVAVELAGRCGGGVRSLTIVEPPVPVPGEPGGTPPPDLHAALRERAERIADKARAAIPAELLDAAEVREGRAAPELERASADLDLLICGSRGYGPVRSLLLGGVTWTLAHTVTCPLLVLPRAVGALAHGAY